MAGGHNARLRLRRDHPKLMDVRGGHFHFSGFRPQSPLINLETRGMDLLDRQEGS